MLDMHEVGGSSPLVSTIDGAALFCRCAVSHSTHMELSALPDSRRNKAASATFLFTYFNFYLTCSLFTFQSLLRFSLLLTTYFRGISAVGSAQHWQCWGQGFKSPMLHHKKHFFEVLFCFSCINFDRYTAQIDKKRKNRQKRGKKS